MMYLQILIAGFGGGVVRGVMGFIKHQYSYKNVDFDLPYFLGMSFISGAVGILTATAAKELGLELFGDLFTPAIAFFIGYSGGDFIENVVKIVLKKPDLYSLPGQDIGQE